MDDDDEGDDLMVGASGTEQRLLSDIERLRIEKEQLTRRLQDQQQTKQDIEVWTQLCGQCIRYTNKCRNKCDYMIKRGGEFYLSLLQQLLMTHSKQEVMQKRLIIPKYIVPDTNCFIFDLISIQRLVSSGHFTVVIPLTGKRSI